MTTSHLPGQPVDLPLPPELSETFGYDGNARFVGFFWNPLGDQLVATDGLGGGTGQSWAYLAYRRHHAVAPLLENVDLGSSDKEGFHMLLIDRELKRVSIAPLREAYEFLSGQHPPPPTMTPEQEQAFRLELEQMLAECCSRPVDHEAIARQMAERRGRVGRMISWLDMAPVPPSRGHKF